VQVRQAVAVGYNRWNYAIGAGIGAGIGGAIGGFLTGDDNRKFSVPFLAVAGVGLGVVFTKAHSGRVPGGFAETFRRDLLESMARRGVLELETPAASSSAYARALQTYLDRAHETVAQSPAAMQLYKSTALRFIERSKLVLTVEGPWDDRVWSAVSKVEAHTEHVEACRELEQLRARVPSDVPEQLAELKREIDETIGRGSRETRFGFPYPDRGTLGTIESQVDMLDQLMGIDRGVV
jgi:hypothetical protein